jgi:hypothetical protein
MWTHLIRGFLSIKKTVHLRTYVIEQIIVASALIITALVTKKALIEWIGVIAVFLTFCYIQIADRMEEREAARQKQVWYTKDALSVHCYYKLPRFYYGKEICWTIYFVYLGARSALVWVALFLIYTPRRRLYRKHHPINAL